MRTASYKTVLDGLLRMRGEVPDNAKLELKLAMAEFLNQGLAKAHEYWRWPELMATEERAFRPAWVDGNYALDDEVYHEEGYWRANASVTTGEEPGVSPKWDALTEFYRYVDYAQSGATPIEAVIEAWSADPRATRDTRAIPFRLDEAGVRFAPDQEGPVWLEFRRRCPDYGWTSVWSAQSYSAGAIVYHSTTGEVYEASANVIGTDVPGAAPAWVRAEVPYIFRNAAKLKGFALWLESQGKTDTAILFDNDDPANPGKFQQELEEQTWQYTKLQGQTGRVPRQQ